MRKNLPLRARRFLHRSCFGTATAAGPWCTGAGCSVDAAAAGVLAGVACSGDGVGSGGDCDGSAGDGAGDVRSKVPGRFRRAVTIFGEPNEASGALVRVGVATGLGGSAGAIEGFGGAC